MRHWPAPASSTGQSRSAPSVRAGDPATAAPNQQTVRHRAWQPSVRCSTKARSVGQLIGPNAAERESLGRQRIGKRGHALHVLGRAPVVAILAADEALASSSPTICSVCGIKVQRAAEPRGDVAQVAERRREVAVSASALSFAPLADGVAEILRRGPRRPAASASTVDRRPACCRRRAPRSCRGG